MTDPKIVFHYAVADNQVIGKDNDMPWHISSDLKRFKTMTMGKPLIMGRRTFQSIGRPLPGRTNIVVTRNEGFSAAGVTVANSVAEALVIATEQAKQDGVDEIAVIGGGAIYNALWDQAEILYVTHIHATPEGDTHVPVIDPAVWRKISTEEPNQGLKDSAPFSFSVYDRQPV